MSATVFTLNPPTVAAIAAIVSSVTAATVRVITVKGKYRAQAADVLVEAALSERERAENSEQENADLRAALQQFINAIEYGAGNGGLSPRAMAQLHRASSTARRLLRHSTKRKQGTPADNDDED